MDCDFTDYESVLKLEPNNKTAKTELEKLDRVGMCVCMYVCVCVYVCVSVCMYSMKVLNSVT